jgi:hypothetical protein
MCSSIAQTNTHHFFHLHTLQPFAFEVSPMMDKPPAFFRGRLGEAALSLFFFSQKEGKKNVP